METLHDLSGSTKFGLLWEVQNFCSQEQGIHTVGEEQLQGPWLSYSGNYGFKPRTWPCL